MSHKESTFYRSKVIGDIFSVYRFKLSVDKICRSGRPLLHCKALFLVAFNFICVRSNWLAITALAEYILSADKSVIDYDDIIALLEYDSQWSGKKRGKFTIFSSK